jgi:CRP/FNR family transcriptional regulator, cyclic AMP receptor protein
MLHVPFRLPKIDFMASRFWHIGSCSLFDQLSKSQLSSLETRARLRVFERGSAVYLPNDVTETVFLLADGRVRLCSHTPEGKQVILGFIEPGEIFGELSLLQEARYEERAEAVSKATVVLIPAEVVRTLMEEDARLSLGVTKLVGFRRTRIERRLRSLMFRSTRDRIAQLLLDLCEQYGRSTSKGVEVGLPLSHQDMAAIVGTTRESTTVVLGELQELGIVQIARQRVVVLDLTALAGLIHAVPPKLDTTSRAEQETLAFHRKMRVAEREKTEDMPHV